MLQDYNLLIKHISGKLHAAPDMLSQPPGTDKGELDIQNVTLLPAKSFICCDSLLIAGSGHMMGKEVWFEGNTREGYWQ